MNFKTALLFTLILPLLIFSSCKKDETLLDTSAKLQFSTDSVLFDTIFTHVGSTTKQFKIYNNYKQKLTISKIHLATGSASAYLINVDGIAGTTINDIEILGGDSLYVFVQVTINPTNQNSPLLIKDSIVFEINGNLQDVKLIAIGQDVYLHKPDHFPTNGFPPYSITGREHFDTILPNDKPHLFFGYTIIDSDCKTTIQAGTKLYFHKGAVLMVFDDGTINVKGAPGNAVVFQGDRLEPEFKELAGQWGKIWLSRKSKNNTIDWAIIKNGSIGVQADTLGVSPNPTLTITNTIVKNMTAAAIYGQGTYIKGFNCVFANCGQYVAALILGGKYKFEQCTFANYRNGATPTTPLLVMNNYYTSGNNLYVRPLDSAYFGNCILYGSAAEEIVIDSFDAGGSFFSYKFDHCILKTNLDTTNDIAHYNVVYKNQDPGFKDIENNDYQLTQNSFAIGMGNPMINISKDLNNQNRPNPIGSNPDLGAYEYYP